MPRLSRSTQAYLLFREHFESGRVTKTTTGTQLREAQDVLGKELRRYTARQVGDAVRAMRAEFFSENDEVTPKLRARTSDEVGTKRARPTDEPNVQDLSGDGSELLMDEASFKPLCLIAPWKDTDDEARTRYSVVLNLPSGLGIGDFRVDVVDGGTVLQLEVERPNYLQDAHALHQFLLKKAKPMPECHPRILSIRDVLKDLRQEHGMRRSEKLKSVSRFVLPSEVDLSRTEIEYYSFPPENDKNEQSSVGMVVYVMLKKKEVEYDDVAKVQDCEFLSVAPN